MTLATDLPFYKMHGLGNDFIVLDSRDNQVMPDEQQMRCLADRHKGVGCDQIMVMRSSDQVGTIRLDMFNADGSPAGACVMVHVVWRGWSWIRQGVMTFA